MRSLPGDFYHRDVLPRLTVDLVYGGDSPRWVQSGAWRARPCPLHGGRSPDSFRVHPESLRWKCWSRCQDSGDPISFLQRRDGYDFTYAVGFLAGLVGVSPPSASMAHAVEPRVRLARPYRNAGAPPRRPPAGQVAQVWAHARPVTDDPEAVAYLAAREERIDAGRVVDAGLARVVPQGTSLPGWASTPRHLANRPWSEEYRLIIPLYGASGWMESLRARLLRSPRDWNEPKALAPKGGSVKGLVLANGLGRALLAGDGEAIELVRQVGVVIAEGEPDFLNAATVCNDADDDAPAVLGVLSGSWTADIAARLPDGARATFLAQQKNGSYDAVSLGYAAQVAASLWGRDVDVQLRVAE